MGKGGYGCLWLVLENLFYSAMAVIDPPGKVPRDARRCLVTTRQREVLSKYFDFVGINLTKSISTFIVMLSSNQSLTGFGESD